MNPDIGAFTRALSDLGEPFVLGFPRLAAMLTITPLFPGSLFPPPVRNGVALALVLPLYPLLRTAVPEAPEHVMAWLAFIAKEIAIGVAIGWAFGVLLWAFESAGTLLDIQTGTASGATFDPLSQQQSAVYAVLLRQAAGTLFIAAGGLLAMVRVAYESFRVWPVQAPLPLGIEAVWELGRATSTQLMSTVLAVALPFVILLLLVELGLGLLNRSLPQLNVFQLAMPVKMVAAILMVLIALSYLADVITQFVRRHSDLASLGLG